MKRTFAIANHFAFSKLTYEENSLIGLLSHFFNSRTNFYHETCSVEMLFKIYINVLKENTSELFKDSLVNSCETYSNPSKLMPSIMNLHIDNADSFLISVLSSNRHIFGCVIRRHTNNYSLTVINKTKRPFFRDNFEEYLIAEKDIQKVMHELHDNSSYSSTLRLYEILDLHAYKSYKLNIRTNESNFTNFFVKDIESAIKFAFSSRKISMKNLKLLRDLTENDLKFNLSWEKPTEHIYEEIVQFLIKRRPNIAHNIREKHEIYIRNKVFRSEIKTRFEREKYSNSFKLITLDKNKDIKDIVFTKEDFNWFNSRLYKMNMDTIIKSEEYIKLFISKMNPSLKKDSLIKLIKYITPVGRYDFFMENENLKEFIYFTHNLGEFMPLVAEQLRNEFHLGYILMSMQSIIKYDFIKAVEYSESAIELNNNSPMPYFFKAISLLELVEHSGENVVYYLNKVIDSLNMAIDRRPSFIEGIVFRKAVYDIMNEKEYSDRDDVLINKINPDIKLELKEYTLERFLMLQVKRVMEDFLMQIEPARIIRNSKVGTRGDIFSFAMRSGYFKRDIFFEIEEIKRLFKKMHKTGGNFTTKRIGFSPS